MGIYSNFDHELDSTVEAELKENPGTEAQHSGWHFCGWISYTPQGMWRERVMRFHQEVDVKEHEDLMTLIRSVNDTWGHE